MSHGPIRKLATRAQRIRPDKVSMSVCDAVVLYRVAHLCAQHGATFLEFAAGWGFSTLCILEAIGKENVRFFTSELAGDCWLALRELLQGTKAELWEGDLRDRDLAGLELDFLFIDSEHTAPIIGWYLDNLFPLVKPSGFIAIHDVLDPTCKPYRQEHKKVLGAMDGCGFERIELLTEEERQELNKLKPWPRSHFGVRRDCNTLVLRRAK